MNESSNNHAEKEANLMQVKKELADLKNAYANEPQVFKDSYNRAVDIVQYTTRGTLEVAALEKRIKAGETEEKRKDPAGNTIVVDLEKKMKHLEAGVSDLLSHHSPIAENPMAREAGEIANKFKKIMIDKDIDPHKFVNLLSKI